MCLEHRSSGSPEIEYSYDLIKRASARYISQRAVVDAVGAGSETEVARQEQEKLAALKDKLASVKAIHDGLLALYSQPDVRLPTRDAINS